MTHHIQFGSAQNAQCGPFYFSPRKSTLSICFFYESFQFRPQKNLDEQKYFYLISITLNAQ